MNTHRTIQHLLLTMAFILGILGSNASAQPDFFDDFSDGDPADGSPVLWHPIFVWDGTGYSLTPEGLDVAGALLSNPDGTVPVYDDVAISTEIRRQANDSAAEWASGFLFRYSENWSNGYWMEVRGPNRFLLGYNSGAILGQAQLPFNVDEQDMMIHMEARGQQIQGWCWAKGQPMPEEPQISVIDTRASTGQIALHAWTVGGQSIFRSVKVHSLHTPIVDFNGDGMLNTTDLVALIESWGQDDPAKDFWHDGTVDRKDLDILMGCWGQAVDDPSLKACWMLDETEGTLTVDSVSGENALVLGSPLWQPEQGQVQGALEFDGVDDMIIGKAVLNPERSPFSVFAWIKGGAPGQVILSQQGGVNWLEIDTDGTLMTELTEPGGRTPGAPLYSETVIIDGNWHRIGFVWDGAQRILYVDDIPVALDTQSALDGATGGLVLGVGTENQIGSFWSGLIDDVRIYDRVVEP